MVYFIFYGRDIVLILVVYILLASRTTNCIINYNIFFLSRTTQCQTLLVQVQVGCKRCVND